MRIFPSRRAFVYIILWALLYSCLIRIFYFAQRIWQDQLLDDGLALIWWSIVLVYFVLDSTLALACIYFAREPFGLTLPKRYPFWYLASDVIVLIFLVHLSWLCIDNPVHGKLELIGLGNLYLFIVIAATSWLVIAGLKYRSTRRLFVE